MNQEIYAGLWVRTKAAIIDMVITAPLLLVILYLIGFDFQSLSIQKTLAGAPPENLIEKIADFASWVISIAYSVYFLTSKQQATPGKKIMGIYVGTRDGQKLSLNHCFARFFATVLSGMAFGIGLVMIAFTKEKTALHDIICNTRVFYGKK
ncbi:MAG: putative RDD family membrane protein YckC [Rickettsiales bacterium]|jgi:uncharacterized RDD family membrane protein YckC